MSDASHLLGMDQNCCTLQQRTLFEYAFPPSLWRLKATLSKALTGHPSSDASGTMPRPIVKANLLKASRKFTLLHASSCYVSTSEDKLEHGLGQLNSSNNDFSELVTPELLKNLCTRPNWEAFQLKPCGQITGRRSASVKALDQRMNFGWFSQKWAAIVVTFVVTLVVTWANHWAQPTAKSSSEHSAPDMTTSSRCVAQSSERCCWCLFVREAAPKGLTKHGYNG